MLSPDYYYSSVQDVDFAALRDRGITTLLVDLDNTLLPRNCEAVTDSACAWTAAAAEAGMTVCVVSNNWHDRVMDLARDMGVPIVAKALKPFPQAFRRALGVTGSRAEQVAVVGDQMFTDVLGGKLMGAVTVLVKPLSSSDLPHTRLLRLIEKALLAGRRPLP